MVAEVTKARTKDQLMQDEERKQAAVELKGPWRFQLLRKTPMLTKPGIVADGCMFDDGACVLRWRGRYNSTGCYANADDLMAIHGHEGDTKLVWIDETRTKAFSQGVTDCTQDYCENAPFGSVGGLEARNAMKPRFAAAGDESEYLRGYVAAARALYGADWRTCEFGWSPALTIGASE